MYAFGVREVEPYQEKFPRLLFAPFAPESFDRCSWGWRRKGVERTLLLLNAPAGLGYIFYSSKKRRHFFRFFQVLQVSLYRTAGCRRCSWTGGEKDTVKKPARLLVVRCRVGAPPLKKSIQTKRQKTDRPGEASC